MRGAPRDETRRARDFSTGRGGSSVRTVRAVILVGLMFLAACGAGAETTGSAAPGLSSGIPTRVSEPAREAAVPAGGEATEADVASSSCPMPEVDPGTSQPNLDGGALALCGQAPRTGFLRDGRCTTGPDDHGVHVVCAEVTDAFLSFTAAAGNDLTTPRGSFPGLHEGDRWCLCASRWAEAHAAGVAPPVVLEATHARALELIPREALERHALR